MMERIQGPINSYFFGEHLEVNCFQQGFISTEDEEQLYISSLEDEKMPFLQMLQSVGSSQQFFPFAEANFQTFLRLQNLKKQQQPWEDKVHLPGLETPIQAKELESCVTHDVVEIHSPMKSQTNEESHLPPRSATTVQKQQTNQAENSSRGPKRRKRKRTRPVKNKEEVENQRMTHIAVERNRRRQMNDHLSVLRTLMPPSYIQRGDQASIIGGAIDFVKELEQLLQTLEAQKRIRKNEEARSPYGETVKSSSLNNEEREVEHGGEEEELKEAEIIEVTVIQTHVNLKIRCSKRQGQLVRAIVGLEDLRLSVLHLNITSSPGSVLFCFNLKIEDECKLGSANEIAEAVRDIFGTIYNY
ncbi:transcription factor bHLH70-like [Prosopis cineraria]|uniref:transcription factor bHLH70-like n=1 Tax=Prosopis cineraria TaxID=364024 RepID=UPI00240F4FDD|nr:transcription factor bHLH70-like [Prosopis cineraria]